MHPLNKKRLVVGIVVMLLAALSFQVQGSTVIGCGSSTDPVGVKGYSSCPTNGNLGILGSSWFGAMGYTPSTPAGGLLGVSLFGAYGWNGTNDARGWLGSADYGAYGEYPLSGGSVNYGYLGGKTYGLCAKATGAGTCGGVLKHSSGSYTYMATDYYGAVISGPGTFPAAAYIGLLDRGVHGVGAKYGVSGFNKISACSGYLGGTNFGVCGECTCSNCWAGYFKGDVLITGSAYVYGSKHQVMQLEDSSWVAMCANESPYTEYTLFGQAQLKNGKTYVEFEHPFPEVISKEVPVKVVVTPGGSWSGIYVTDVSVKGFTAVSETGDMNARFNYMVAGRSKALPGKPDSKTLTEKMRKIPDLTKELEEDQRSLMEMEKKELKRIQELQQEHKKMEAKHQKEMEEIEKMEKELLKSLEEVEIDSMQIDEKKTRTSCLYGNRK